MRRPPRVMIVLGVEQALRFLWLPISEEDDRLGQRQPEGVRPTPLQRLTSEVEEAAHLAAIAAQAVDRRGRAERGNEIRRDGPLVAVPVGEHVVDISECIVPTPGEELHTSEPSEACDA